MKKLILALILLCLPAMAHAGALIDYTLGTAALTDQFVGIDDPSGTWAVNRWTVADTLALLIDDTKGNGDTTFTWSADKIYDQLALKANLASPSLTTPDIGAATGTSLAASGNVSGATYGSDGSVSDAELLYINSLSSNAQTQIDSKEDAITEGSIGDGYVVLDDLKGEAKWVREAITTDADPYSVTPTAGWAAYHEFDLFITPHTTNVSLQLTKTGPPADGTLCVINNVGANDIDMTDIGSQQEIPNDGTITIAAGEYVTFKYDTDRWRLLSSELSTLSFATITTVETEFIPVGYMIDGASAPDALATVTSVTDKVNARTFDGAADEDVVFDWQVPADIVASDGIKYRVICFITAATGPSNEKWDFQLAGFSLGDGDALDGTLGTAMDSGITGRTDAQYDRVATSWSSAMTSTHITDLTAGETVEFKLNRDADGANDDYAQLVGVIGIELKYKRTHDTTF